MQKDELFRNMKKRDTKGKCNKRTAFLVISQFFIQIFFLLFHYFQIIGFQRAGGTINLTDFLFGKLVTLFGSKDTFC